MFWGYPGSLIATLATAAGMLVSPSAPPESRDAVHACGATEVTRSGASVDPSIWQAPFQEVPGLTVRCGDGQTYGAVHVEVKHNVPNWADALACITKAMSRTTPQSMNGKQVYHYDFGNKRLTMSTGRNGLITAFPSDNAHGSWVECSQS